MNMILTDSERYNVGLLESVRNLRNINNLSKVGSVELRYPVSSYRMARRVAVGCLLHGEGTKVYFSHTLKYHEMLEDVLSIWAVPAGSLAQPHCSTRLALTSMLLQGFVVYLMFPRHLLQL